MARSPENEEKYDPLKIDEIDGAIGGTLVALPGIMATVGMGEVLRRNDLRRETIAQIKSDNATLMEMRGTPLPDQEDPTLKAAITKIGKPLDEAHLECVRQRSNSELVEACRVIEGPSKIVAEYNAKLAVVGIPRMERSLQYEPLQEAFFYGGGAMSIIGLSILAGASTELAMKKFRQLALS